MVLAPVEVNKVVKFLKTGNGDGLDFELFQRLSAFQCSKFVFMFPIGWDVEVSSSQKQYSLLNLKIGSDSIKPKLKEIEPATNKAGNFGFLVCFSFATSVYMYIICRSSGCIHVSAILTFLRFVFAIFEH